MTGLNPALCPLAVVENVLATCNVWVLPHSLTQ